MSKPKHTPGPWGWTKFNWPAHQQLEVEEVNRWELCQRTEAGDKEILSISDRGNNSVLPDEANARLIAAAPELLEALNRFAKMNTRQEWTDELNNAIVDARTLVAKAEGD